MENLYSAYGFDLSTATKVEEISLEKLSELNKISFSGMGPKSIARKMKTKYPYPIIKLIIPRSLHSKAIDGLNRMNINRETLFPGVDGLAMSLVQTVIRS
ncbi:hypothetical protein FY034_11935 [Trichlorobacter lovleyi]|uniref:hypothetical protein n=1 Tax=Trichlorobacter lovleyi TaxID=313985 RepID=UPI00223EEE4F|nr:hypothetical protein [Trichlorobacter lovleyi]QOX79621.1 hypothetical protein FY034_11935 [Trichlorobacter lovleyi]